MTNKTITLDIKTSRLSDARLSLRTTVHLRKVLLDQLNRQMDDDEWRRIDDIRTELERPIIAEMDVVFREQNQEAQDALNALRSAVGEQRAIFSLDSIFNTPKWLESTWNRLKGFFLKAIIAGYDIGGIQGEVDLPDLTSFDPAVRQQLEVMAAKTKNITYTTRDKLRDLVDDALRNGTSVDDLALQISDTFDGYTASRSKLIAQTNVTGAFGKGQKEAFTRAGLGKRWISQRDGVVRPSHFAADGQEQSANDPFEVGKAVLQFPGDPETTILSEIMGCRCAMLPVRI